MQFDKGYLSPYFVTNAGAMEPFSKTRHPHLREKNLELEGFASVARESRQSRPSAPHYFEDVEGEALATLVVNKLRGTLPGLRGESAGFGDRRKAMLEDIAVLTAAG